MTVKVDLPTAILVVLIAVMVSGMALAYPLNHNEFKAEVTNDGSDAQVKMHATVQSDYRVCAIDLANTAERELLFYYDESYASLMDHQKEWESADKLESQLKYLNVTYTKIDAATLKTILSDVSSAPSKSIAFFSGAFPCNVYSYDGSVFTDLVTPWMEGGGVIYWQSEYRFGYYSAPLEQDLVDWDTDQPLDEGATHFNLAFLGDEEDDQGIGGGIRSEVSQILNIEQSMVKTYAPVSNPDIVNFGFESDDGRYSMAYAKYGSGGVVIMGGDFTPEISTAKIIASKVCDWANYTPSVQTGVFKGDCTLTLSTTGVDAIYVYMGTLTPRYGELFLL